MTGASLTLAPDYGMLLAWETKGQISFSHQSFVPSRVNEIFVAPRGKYPIALENPDHFKCVSWKEGPQLKWQLFGFPNKPPLGGPLGKPGSAPAPSGDRHAGAVTRAGDFVLFP